MNGRYRAEGSEGRDGPALLHGELTEKVLEACYEVIDELGTGFLESVYQRALLVALHQKGIQAKGQHPLKVRFRGYIVGDYMADVFVEEKIILELKAVKTLSSEHQAQVYNYLKATGVEVGLLINFGYHRLEFRRLQRTAG